MGVSLSLPCSPHDHSGSGVTESKRARGGPFLGFEASAPVAATAGACGEAIVAHDRPSMSRRPEPTSGKASGARRRPFDLARPQALNVEEILLYGPENPEATPSSAESRSPVGGHRSWREGP